MYVVLLDGRGLPYYPVLTPRTWSCFLVYGVFLGYEALLWWLWSVETS